MPNKEMFSDDPNPMENLPDEIKSPQIPYFRQKPPMLKTDGFILFFKKINKIEYWICEQQNKNSYLVQWLEIRDSKPQNFHRKLTNRNGLDVDNQKRDTKLIQTIRNKQKIEKAEIQEYLEEVGVYISENRALLSPEPDDLLEDSLPPIEAQEEVEEISEGKREELIQILKRPDLLSFIDQALYERTPETGFIIGEIESKHILNFNCIGAKLGLSTINTLKGASAIGKTNTANVVTGLHRTKKVGSLSQTALKYAEDMNKIDILYIQETLEDEFKNKETRLLSADDGGFIAETTVKNPDTGLFEVQQTTIPVKTIVTTTTAIELDPEFATRNFIIPVDDSEEQTIRILEENFKSTEKTIKELTGEIDFDNKYKLLKEAFDILEPHIVLIPYEKDLMDIFPTSNPRSRRDSKKLMQLIKESALLFQYQRCKTKFNDQPVLVASWVDLAHAILLGGPILDATLTGFDQRLLKALPAIYEIIEEKGYVTTKSLHQKLEKSSKYAWKILNFFEEKGYIYHDIDIKRSYRIKGKAKVYVKSGAKEYKNLLLSMRNIDWPNIKNTEEKFIGKQIPNSSHQVGYTIQIPKYDSHVPNKVTYYTTSISSEEFRIYSKKNKEEDKSNIKTPDILPQTNRNRYNYKQIKQAENVEIDYRNITVIEGAILSELVNFVKHTYKSIIDTLRSTYSENEINQTLTDMEQKGWIV